MFFSWLLNGGDPNHVSKSRDDPPSAHLEVFKIFMRPWKRYFPSTPSYFGWKFRGWQTSTAKHTSFFLFPRCSMYGLFTYIWVVLGVHVGKYTIHWASGFDMFTILDLSFTEFSNMGFITILVKMLYFSSQHANATPFIGWVWWTKIRWWFQPINKNETNITQSQIGSFPQVSG